MMGLKTIKNNLLNFNKYKLYIDWIGLNGYRINIKNF